MAAIDSSTAPQQAPPGPSTLHYGRWRTVEFVLLAIALGAMLAFVLPGLRWGLPDRIRNALEPPPQKALSVPSEMVERSWLYWRSRSRNPELRNGFSRNLFNALRSSHPDEYVVLKSLSNMHPTAGDFDPHLYLYPSLHFYSVGAALAVAHLTNYVQIHKDLGFYLSQPEMIARMYIVGRILSLSFACGAVAVLFAAARRTLRSGTAAAFALALSPVLVIHAHYMTRDTLSAFLSVCLFYACHRISCHPRARWYALAAILVGLCAGTNYMWLILWVVVATAHALAVRRKLCPRSHPWFWATLPIAAVAFALCAFYALRQPALLAEDFHSEVVHWSLGRALGRLVTLRWATHLLALLPAMFGLPLAALIASGLLALAYQALSGRSKNAILALAWVLPIWLVVGLDGRDYSRYYLVGVPALALAAAGAMAFARDRMPSLRLPLTVVLLAALAIAATQSIAWARLFARPDVRTEAALWISQNIPHGSSIAMTKTPWNYEMPPIDSEKYRIIVTGEDAHSLAESCADYFIASSAQYGPVLRDADSHMVAFWQSVLSGYPQALPYITEKSFHHPPTLLGIRLPPLTVPEDMTYVNPTITIYRRTAPCPQ